jgi:hypothetical protein
MTAFTTLMSTPNISLILAVLGSLAVAAILAKEEPDSGDWWLPLFWSIAAFVVFFIAALCGLTNDKHEPAWLLAMVIMPFEFYLIRVIQYCRLCSKRRTELNRILNNLRPLPAGTKKPFNNLFSPLTEDAFEHALGKIKKCGEQKAIELFEALALEHRDTLERKRGQSTFIDEYNRLQDEGWKKHAAYFIYHVATPIIREANLPSPYTGMEWLPILTNIITEQQPLRTRAPLLIEDVESGVEYEVFVADLLRADGWEIQMTPATGDQGADVIATKNKFRVAIQCKLWSSPVSNASVQEVYTAKGFYQCDAGIVVSNADYTRSARHVATKLQVPLVHHDQIVKVMHDLAPKQSRPKLNFGSAE